jgi:hypothetical protein
MIFLYQYCPLRCYFQSAISEAAMVKGEISDAITTSSARPWAGKPWFKFDEAFPVPLFD